MQEKEKIEKEDIAKENTPKEEKTTKETIKQIKKQQNNKKIRRMIVIVFLTLFALISYIAMRGSYLEYKELGEQYVQEFLTNYKVKYSIMAIIFVFLYFLIYITNRGIKKGLKEFFEKEKKEMPKLPNKSLALIISAITSVITSNGLVQKVILGLSNSSFGKTESIFGLDIGYYFFQKPLIDQLLTYAFWLIIGLTLYMALYYIIVFNRYFDGVDGTVLRESLFIKKILRNVMLIAIVFGIGTICNTQNILFGKITTIENSATTRFDGVSSNLELTGASYTDTTIKRWGYTIFGIVIIICVAIAIKYFKQKNTQKVLKSLAGIPVYLVGLFIVLVGFNLIFVTSNRLDKEKTNIANNIESTKSAYGIDVNENSLEYSGTITEQEVKNNDKTISNIPLISKEAVIATVQEKQTGTGYYTYRQANLAKYKIDGKEQLVYISPREIVNSGRTYTNKTYEYTHGIGQIVTSATSTTENGDVQYLQKDVSGKDDKLNTENQQIYFGLETNDTIATNAKNKKEYDYTDELGNEYTSTYSGQAGLKLNFGDRLILALSKGDIKLAFSGEITQDSKILINRNIIKRAKKAMPYLLYDDEPYTIVTDEGKIKWVLDAYTISSNYPYSQYTSIEYNNKKQKINYIKNSVKVIIDAYDGTIDYYITDKTDPIAMAYNNTYKGLFKEEVPEDIANHFTYPKYLYKVQAELLKSYHNAKPDILYRADDIWDFAKYNNNKVTKSTGGILEPYYTIVQIDGKNELGLVQIYTPNQKQNLISYLVGTVENGTNKLHLYKFSQDSNVVGPIQLEKQIEQDEAISKEIEALNTTGTKVTKSMIAVPIGNTILYVEPIYQTKLNESKIPLLKKVIVSSGNKIAIGDTLEKSLENLLSTYAVDIEIENTENMQGLIEAIIKANNNLTESNENDDWEMMGKDLKRLQELIKSLETMNEEQSKKDEKQTNTTNTTNTLENTTK